MIQETAREQTGEEREPGYASVVIVGAGPTGLTMGNLLGMQGIQTLMFESNAELSNHPKAISIDDEGLRTCQAMGLSAEVMRNALLDIDAHYVSSGRLLAKVAPTTKRNGFPFVSTLHQPVFEATLLNGLKRFQCVHIYFGHTVETFTQTDQHVTVSVRTPEGMVRQIACAYMLACDGGKSSIRRMLGIPMEGTTFAQKWLVVDCEHDEDPSTTACSYSALQCCCPPLLFRSQTMLSRLASLMRADKQLVLHTQQSGSATFFCNPRRPAVTVPVPHHGRRWEFMLLPGEQQEDMLSKECACTLIQQLGGSQNPRIIRQAVYTFHAAIARTFANGRIFLLGDAAHLMPPFGGQGMNSGLHDARNLSWKLAMVLRGEASPRLLKTYHVERYHHAAQMIRLSALLGKVVMPTTPLAALLRDTVLRTLNTIPAIRTYITEARLKPQPRYKKGFMITHGSRKTRSMVGLLLPQPEVLTAQGERVLLDEVLGGGFVLLHYHSNPLEAFTPIQAEVWKRLGVQLLCIQPAGTMPIESDLCTVVTDIEGKIGTFLQHNRDLCVVIRPDHYIFGVSQAGKAAKLAAIFQKLLLRM